MLLPPWFRLPLREAGDWPSGILLCWEQDRFPASQGDFSLSSLWSRTLHCTRRDSAFNQARSPELKDPAARRHNEGFAH